MHLARTFADIRNQVVDSNTLDCWWVKEAYHSPKIEPEEFIIVLQCSKLGTHDDGDGHESGFETEWIRCSCKIIANNKLYGLGGRAFEVPSLYVWMLLLSLYR